jgi:hypothetical protein
MPNQALIGHDWAPAREQSPHHARLPLWIGLLFLAELADLITTHADRARGGMEANRSLTTVSNVVLLTQL